MCISSFESHDFLLLQKRHRLSLKLLALWLEGTCKQKVAPSGGQVVAFQTGARKIWLVYNFIKNADICRTNITGCSETASEHVSP